MLEISSPGPIWVNSSSPPLSIHPQIKLAKFNFQTGRASSCQWLDLLFTSSGEIFQEGRPPQVSFLPLNFPLPIVKKRKLVTIGKKILLDSY